MVRHPQVKANGYIEDIDAPGGERVEAVGLPFRVSGLSKANRLPVPKIGEHDAIVRDAIGRQRRGN